MSNTSADTFPPIVFLHGNGDTAALWLTTVWRFESNGWPPERLHAIDMPCPLARDDDGIAQPGRSSSDDARRCVADAVEQACRRHGVAQVVLIANSRGGFAVRNFIANGGAAQVSHAILGGTPNHGVWADAGFRPGNEFNGAGPFLQRLNAGDGDGDETTPGPRWMTVRSDANDKYAQPDGLWIGAPGRPTGVGADSPALRGAHNVVIAGIDHRETSFGPAAFDAMWRFLTGRAPATLQPTPSDGAIELAGTVSGLHPQAAVHDNLPLAGATVEVHATDPATGERVGAPLYRGTVGRDGAWGPLSTDSRTPLEFVVDAPGHGTTHVYRSPFARSSSLVHLRAMRLADVDADADAAPAADRDALALVQLSRPRGYFGVPRDRVLLDGHPPAGLPPGVAGLSLAAVKVTDTAGRAVAAEFNGERIVGRAWPCADGHVVLLELHS